MVYGVCVLLRLSTDTQVSSLSIERLLRCVHGFGRGMTNAHTSAPFGGGGRDEMLGWRT